MLKLSVLADRLLIAIGLVVAAILLSATSPLGAATPAIRLVSATAGRTVGDAASATPAVAANGRFVVFMSAARDLVPGDDNGVPDIFVRDLVERSTTLVSVDMAGGPANEQSGFAPSISDDGRYVAFWSYASDLVAGDNNGQPDVFIRDMFLATTARISVDQSGGDANGESYPATISGDGSLVTFGSYASDLVAEDGNDAPDVFVRDIGLERTERISIDEQAGDANGPSFEPDISSDGRWVAFSSEASDLVADDGNQWLDIFVRDLTLGITTRVTRDTNGGDPNLGCYNPSISATGRRVAYRADASDLVPDDGNSHPDVFVTDLTTGTTNRVSDDSAGGDADDGSGQPKISGNGRFVAFSSLASDLVTQDSNGLSDIFVYDLRTATTTRVSVDMTGGDADGGHSSQPDVTANGRVVVFASVAHDLIVGDDNNTFDVFVRRRA